VDGVITVDDIKYSRRGKTGLLTLEGALNIAQAEAMKETALKAIADDKAAEVNVNATAFRTADAASWQILLATFAELTSTGRPLKIVDGGDTFTSAASSLGIALPVH